MRRLFSSSLMVILFSFVFGVGVFGAPIDDNPEDEPCGSHISPDRLRIVEKQFADRKAANLTDPGLTAKFSTTVSVVWNSIEETSGGKGSVTNKQMDDTIAKLNASFLGSGFSFVLTLRRRYVSQAWFNADKNSNDEKAMRKQLRQGGATTLNIYTTNFGELNPKLLGHSTFPWDYSPGADKYLDGVVVKYIVVSGGSATNYNQGATFVHEVGHWLGLYHTFQNGCSTDSDFVSDTPAQADSTSGCPASRDSCPNLPGLDPIHNFMDYSYDSCRNNFTAGQFNRIVYQWLTWRARAGK